MANHNSRVNTNRRHCTQEQKRNTIRDQLKETPEKSDNLLATWLGVTDKTVRAIRTELEATSEIPKLEKLTGADGKERPRTIERLPVNVFLPKATNLQLERIRAVQHAATENPQQHGKLLDTLNKGRVTGAYGLLQRNRMTERLHQPPKELEPPATEGRAMTALRHIHKETGAVLWYELKIGPNATGMRIASLYAEKEATPEYQSRRTEAERLRQEADRLRKEADRLEKQAGLTESEVKEGILYDLEDEHGVLYPCVETYSIEVVDAELNAELAQYGTTEAKQIADLLAKSLGTAKIRITGSGMWGDCRWWFLTKLYPVNDDAPVHMKGGDGWTRAGSMDNL